MIAAEHPTTSSDRSSLLGPPSGPLQGTLPPRSLVLRGVSWETYRALRDAAENQRLRMTFDRGALEIMSPARKHGKIANLLGLMIYEWTRRRKIPIESGRDMTCRRADLQRGLEPDHCYWIAHEAAVRGKDEIDLSRDPPPDLALEVDVSHASLAKLPIYQALGIPEVWRWQAERLEVLVLGAAGEYGPATDSSALPGFPIRQAQDFLAQRDGEDETTLMERFAAALPA